MFDLLMPANAKGFFKHIVAIATFDLVPTEGIMSWIEQFLETTRTEGDINNTFEEFDYATTDPIQNLKFIFLLAVFLVLLPLLMKAIKLVTFFSKDSQKKIKMVESQYIYWNLYIRFMLETNLEFCLSAFIRIHSG